MKLKELLLKADALIIKSDIGNTRYYDENNSDYLHAQFTEDTVTQYTIAELLGTRTLVVKLKNWR